MLTTMKNDDISFIVRHDQLIVQFGSSLSEKVGKKQTNYISFHASRRLFDPIETQYFDSIVNAVKGLCKFNKKEHLDVEMFS